MKKNDIQLLVTFDKQYIRPFCTMLKSLLINNPDETVHVWLLHSAIPEDTLNSLKEYCSLLGVPLNALRVNREMFQNSHVTRRYPQEMYYRLLAPHILPDSLQNVLYLDPDILVINPLRPLMDIELGDKAFAAASHCGLTDVMNEINRIRLGTEHDYYNTGVMRINLPEARKVIKPGEIFLCCQEHESELLLPDQDIFNHLYGSYTLPVDDAIWNYDARHYSQYLLRSSGAYDLNWVIENTAILHFCGRGKPWAPSYSQRFSALYKHYMHRAAI